LNRDRQLLERQSINAQKTSWSVAGFKTINVFKSELFSLYIAYSPYCFYQ